MESTFASKQNQLSKPVTTHRREPKYIPSASTHSDSASPYDFAQIQLLPSAATRLEEEADRMADAVVASPGVTLPEVSTASTALIQRKPEGTKQPQNPGPKKAELEFHSTLAFNSTATGFNPTGPPAEEGFHGIRMRWAVWNTGFETAPEHIDRLTLYDANRCSGCRNPNDEMLSVDVTAPEIVSITQEGTQEYEAINPMIGMTLHAGHYDAYVDLDVHDEVEEINEDNNTAFMTFYVKPAKPESEEEEVVQRKAIGPGPIDAPGLESQIEGFKSGGEPLPQSARDFFEPRFGYDFSQVRIHSDARAAESARGLQAKAFTLGTDVVFGEGQYDAETVEGHRLLAHELTHVVQQTTSSEE